MVKRKRGAKLNLNWLTIRGKFNVVWKSEDK